MTGDGRWKMEGIQRDALGGEGMGLHLPSSLPIRVIREIRGFLN